MKLHQKRSGLSTRTGLTLIELIAVLAIILILAAIALPSVGGMKGNADQKAAVDMIMSRLADARRLAMEHGIAYRLAIQNGTKLRLAPDDTNFSSAGAADTASSSAKVIETDFEKASAGLGVDPNAEDNTPAPTSDGTGWTTIATYLPDGTCRENRTFVDVNEEHYPTIRIQVRGITGAANIVAAPGKGGAP